MTTETTNTPKSLPWRLGSYSGFYPVDGGPVIGFLAYSHGGPRQDAKEHEAFIVMACNAHEDLVKNRDALLEALKDAEEFVDSHSEEWYTSGQKTLAHIRTAIVHATAKEPTP